MNTIKMDFQTILTQSGKLLRDHPKITLPFIINQFILYSIIFLISGLGIYSSFSESIIQKQPGQFIIFLLIGFICWFCITIIFSSWGYYQNTSFLKKESVSLGNSFLHSLSFFFKLFFIRIIFMIIILIPVLLLFIPVIYSFTIHPLIGVVSVLLLSALVIIWILAVSVRLFFAEVQVFVDKKIKLSAFGYLKRAYSFSKGKSGSIILLLLIILVVHFLVNTITSNPFTGVIFQFMKTYQIYIFYSIAFLFSLVLAIITGATSAFTNLMMIKSYMELKKDK